jgi:hypothetical protein
MTRSGGACGCLDCVEPPERQQHRNGSYIPFRMPFREGSFARLVIMYLLIGVVWTILTLVIVAYLLVVSSEPPAKRP